MTNKYLKSILRPKINSMYFSKYATLAEYKRFVIFTPKISIADIRINLNLFKENSEIDNLIKDYFIIENDLKEEFSSNVLKELFKKVEMKSNLIVPFIKNNEIAQILKEFSDESCLVGGAVRDILLHKEPKDFDFVTDIPYDNLIKIFTENGYSVKEKGKHFLVLIVIKDGIQTEIANFRKDNTYSDGRRPDSVSIGTINDDFERRDFTINALYFNLRNKSLLLNSGLDDIENKILRFVGNPYDRINEDYLRVFRFFRFLKTKNLKADPKSLSACRNMFDTAIKNSNSQRILSEIEKF